MDSIEHYQYRELNGSDAIRLIKLYPSADLQAQVRCELLHTSLTECEDNVFNIYAAISYVCGSFSLLFLVSPPCYVAIFL